MAVRGGGWGVGEAFRAGLKQGLGWGKDRRSFHFLERRCRFSLLWCLGLEKKRGAGMGLELGAGTKVLVPALPPIHVDLGTSP